MKKRFCSSLPEEQKRLFYTDNHTVQLIALAWGIIDCLPCNQIVKKK